MILNLDSCPDQGRSKHLETGPDVNTVKPHPLINQMMSHPLARA